MGLAIVAFTVATRDPDSPLAIGVVAAGVALTTGGLVGGALVWDGLRRNARGVKRDRAVARGLRRGAMAGCILALGVLLRALDGLTPLTAILVAGPFIVAEAILSARRA